MKVLVFGARGRTGRELVKLFDESELIAFEGDALNAELVDEAVKKADAVVSVIGHVKGSDPRVQTKVIQNIVESMKKHDKNRIVSLTGTGVRFPGDKITPIDRLLNLGITIIDRDRVIDGREHAEVLKTSGLDWTIVRVLKLTNQPNKDDWSLQEDGPAKTLVPRATVARAIRQILNTNQFSKSAPIIAKKAN